ncbi:MAG: hypothetical protein QF441_12510 [Bacteriovoracaceae bacterium]|jgi:hypothetical protein|nr:hypothetical protein [Halobacteriovoraceae bacterium]MDP7321427.1 hypothetical protein [Bacteriovoracaceae bacterium]
MKDFKEVFKNLEQTRDELKLQAHLFEADLKTEWEGLEKKWDHVRGQVKPSLDAAKDASENISEAHKLLLSEIKEGYQKIKKTL